jgi:squalene-hopene/tetraprenyl-beta-curcumene cyclase
MTPTIEITNAIAAGVAEAIRKASEAIVLKQHKEGFWWADLTADTTLESDYILQELWNHSPVNGVWNPPTRERIDRAVTTILSRQLPDGGFNIYLQGPSEVSASVKAYFALKVAGVSPDESRMIRLRNRILELGGVQAANSYVRINLSLFGLVPRSACPSIPPEIILLPGNFLYQMSSWTRAIVIPLSVVFSSNPQRPVPTGFNVDELFLKNVPLAFSPPSDLVSWSTLFFAIDRALKLYENYFPFLRKRAIRKCQEWMTERFDGSDGLGAIYPSMQYAIMALDQLGYSKEHQERRRAQAEFDKLMVDSDTSGFFYQPCFSPVWDSAIAGFALGEAGVPAKNSLERLADWLLSKEVRRKGDWSVKRPNVEPSGWAFEFNNEFYPDIDDTAMVLLAFKHACGSDEVKQQACEKRAVDWLLSMQGGDGGWAAFDVDNNWQFLSHVPFADHNAMLDPSCPDITGRVIEALIRSGVKPNHPAIRRGIEYLWRSQEQDGSWYGRWGVNYLYGTFLALRGLQAAGVSDREPGIQFALEFIRAYQNRDGGWGESCASYDEGHFVPNPNTPEKTGSTPSQTAWAILGLLAGGDTRSSSLTKAVEYLIGTQRPDGCWNEAYCTGTGFPKVFYLAYTEYRNSFPLLALAAYRKAMASQRVDF